MSSRRSKRKKAKPRQNQGISSPADAGPRQPCNDQLRIHGGVEVDIAKSLKDQHNIEYKQASNNSRAQLIATIAATIVALVVAFFTGWQAWESRKIAATSQDTFNSANRPYVGINGVEVFYYDQTGKQTPAPTKDSIGMTFTPEVKNFGPVPATNHTHEIRMFLDGKPAHETYVPDHPSILFPGQILYLKGDIRGRGFQDMMAGSSTLVFEVEAEYDGPGHHYKYCEKNQYNAQAWAFMNLGTCDGK